MFPHKLGTLNNVVFYCGEGIPQKLGTHKSVAFHLDAITVILLVDFVGLFKKRCRVRDNADDNNNIGLVDIVSLFPSNVYKVNVVVVVARRCYPTLETADVPLTTYK